jgi:Holliday junction resolvase RusA-like endonuclease
MKLGKTNVGPNLRLEDCFGYCSVLVTVKTNGKNKKVMIEEIKNQMNNWLQNLGFEKIRDKPLDIAIIFNRNPMYYNKQDVDNVAKIVLDALKKNSRNNDNRFLFFDDSQVVRLLVWKLEAPIIENWGTENLLICFRVHDSSKQMILIETNVI